MSSARKRAAIQRAQSELEAVKQELMLVKFHNNQYKSMLMVLTQRRDDKQPMLVTADQLQQMSQQIHSVVMNTAIGSYLSEADRKVLYGVRDQLIQEALITKLENTYGPSATAPQAGVEETPRLD